MFTKISYKTREKLIYLSMIIFFVSLTIISSNKFLRMSAGTNFLYEARQAATVEVARNALEKGEPLLIERMPNTLELKIWQSNLKYLREQPALSLLSPQIEKSIDSNVDNIEYSKEMGFGWMIIAVASIMSATYVLLTLLHIWKFLN